MNEMSSSAWRVPDSGSAPAQPGTGNSEPGTSGPAPAVVVHDCWNKIGITGDGSCAELQAHVHCRNCPVYAAAGAQLLNRPLPADYRRERTAHFAQPRQTAAPTRTSALIFRIGSEWLALPSAVFQEVAESRPVHSLPHRRQGVVLGLVNVRGELLICVALSRLLGIEVLSVSGAKPKTSANDSAVSLRPSTFLRLLVANWDGQRLAFPVDEVLGIQRLETPELKAAPAGNAKAAQTFTQGIFAWRDHTVGFLNADSLFATLNRSLT